MKGHYWMTLTGLEKHNMNKWTVVLINISLANVPTQAAVAMLYSLVYTLLYDNFQDHFWLKHSTYHDHDWDITITILVYTYSINDIVSAINRNSCSGADSWIRLVYVRIIPVYKTEMWVHTALQILSKEHACFLRSCTCTLLSGPWCKAVISSLLSPCLVGSLLSWICYLANVWLIVGIRDTPLPPTFLPLDMVNGPVKGSCSSVSASMCVRTCLWVSQAEHSRPLALYWWIFMPLAPMSVFMWTRVSGCSLVQNVSVCFSWSGSRRVWPRLS